MVEGSGFGRGSGVMVGSKGSVRRWLDGAGGTLAGEPGVAHRPGSVDDHVDRSFERTELITEST